MAPIFTSLSDKRKSRLQKHNRTLYYLSPISRKLAILVVGFTLTDLLQDEIGTVYADPAGSSFPDQSGSEAHLGWFVL